MRYLKVAFQRNVKKGINTHEIEDDSEERVKKDLDVNKEKMNVHSPFHIKVLLVNQ